MKKKLMSLMLTVVMLCSMLVGTAGAVDIESFSDVQSSDWFYQYVDLYATTSLIPMEQLHGNKCAC